MYSLAMTLYLLRRTRVNTKIFPAVHVDSYPHFYLWLNDERLRYLKLHINIFTLEISAFTSIIRIYLLHKHD